MHEDTAELRWAVKVLQELLCDKSGHIGSLYNGHGRALIVALAVLTDCLNGHASVPQGETENVKRKAIRLASEPL